MPSKQPKHDLLMILIIFAAVLYAGVIYLLFKEFVIHSCVWFGMESTHFLVVSARECLRWIGVLVLVLAIMPILSYKFFLHEPSQWIRWEWKLLVALKKDVEYISEEGTKINEKANKIWGSYVRPEVTGPQIDAYRRWAETAKDVITKAERWYEAYERLNKGMVFPKSLFFPFWDFKAKYDLRLEGHQIELELYQIRKTYRDAQHMCGSLERSVSNVRSLQERPIVDTVYERDENWNKPIDQNLGYLTYDWGKRIYYSIMLPLQLLLDYLRHLEGIRLETETGKAWVLEAKEILGELQHDMDSIRNTANGTGWVSKLMVKFKLGNLCARMETMIKDLFELQHDMDSIRNTANGTGWVSKLMVKFMLRNLCARMETMIKDLFERKDMYGITFVRRDASKAVVHPFALSLATIYKLGILDLVQDIHNQLNQKPNSVIFKELSQLHDNLKKVHNHLIDAAKAVEVIGHSGKAWMDQMTYLVADAKNFFNTCRTIKLDNAKKIQQYECALSLVELSIKVCRIELREEINLVVGLEENIHEVVPRLTSNSEHLSILSIVGMKGIGKTTLARVILNHRAIQDHFGEFRYWVPIRDTVDDVNVLKLLGEKVLPNHEKQNGNEKIPTVSDFLKDEKYLLILDNILTNEAWDTLKKALPESMKGSRIVLTTRNRRIASHADQNSIPYQLRLRTKDESWGLFTQMVRFRSAPSSQSEDQKFEELAMRFVGRCGGLPLSIIHLGYLMLGKKVTVGDLTEFEHTNQTAWSETFKINERGLPLHLKHCLSYIGLFPRDSEIPRRRLVALWVAEGLVQHQTGEEQEPLESVAEGYLLELIDHNLVQMVERKINGKVKTCGFPSALRELWLQHNSSSIFSHRVVAYCFDENGASSGHTHSSSISSPNILRRYKNLISILFFDTRDLNKPGEHIGNLLRNNIASGRLLQLQVLDLENVFRPQLPNTLGRLTHLTYLGLRSTYLETIPSSIGNLVNLQTLDVKHTYIRNLPHSIWKLQKLTHLYMNQTYRSKFVHHQRENYLQNLQTLQGAFVDKDSPLMDCLHRLTNLRKLALAFLLNLSKQEALVQSIVKLPCLQTLKLRSIDEMGQPKYLNVKSLSGLGNLSKLYLFGNLWDPFITLNIRNLPESVTDLTLSATRILDDPMPELEKLHNLKWLNFYSNSYTGTKMVCYAGGFPQLLVLKFWMLKELQEWDVGEQAMPNLKQLEIRSCRSLKVPTQLRHLKNLRELKLKDSEKFTTEIERSKDQIWGDIALSPAIIIDEL